MTTTVAYIHCNAKDVVEVAATPSDPDGLAVRLGDSGTALFLDTESAESLLEALRIFLTERALEAAESVVPLEAAESVVDATRRKVDATRRKRPPGDDVREIR